jgi:hypothetical protein
MYTGDDFNYDRLILGDEQGHSDALLGIFDAIAPAASLALAALDAGDIPEYWHLLAPTACTVAAYLWGTDSALQGGRGVPGVS